MYSCGPQTVRAVHFPRVGPRRSAIEIKKAIDRLSPFSVKMAHPPSAEVKNVGVTLPVPNMPL